MKKAVRPFGIRDKMGYLFGDFGNDFTFILSTSILMKFYTNVMGVSAGAVGLIMMAARFVDAVTDITMGRICDRSPVRPAGKFRPWILWMCLPVALSSFLIYQSGLAHMSGGFKTAYLAVTYILWGSFFYTSVNIPYGSMASSISADPGDRQSLSTYRTMGGMLAGTVIGIGIPVFAYETVDGQETLIGSRVTEIAGIFSVLAVVCYVLCYALVRERVQPAPVQKEKASVKKLIASCVHNRALLSVIAASVLMLLAQLTIQNMGAYVYPDYYNNAGAQSVSTVLMMVAMVIASVTAKPIAAKFGKAEVSAAANLFAGAVCVVTFLWRPESVWVYTGLQFLCWLGLGVFSMVSWALITDVIDDTQLRSGVREDGTVYAVYSFARKLGQAAAAGLSGVLLQWIGYAQGAPSQTEGVLRGIFSVSTLVPAVGFIALGLVLIFWYPLHRGKVEENIAALRRLEEKTE